jgi:hypothetical protein
MIDRSSLIVGFVLVYYYRLDWRLTSYGDRHSEQEFRFRKEDEDNYLGRIRKSPKTNLAGGGLADRWTDGQTGRRKNAAG